MRAVGKRAVGLLLSLVMLFSLGMVGIQPALAAESATNGVHDIFVAKDDTPLEQFKARVLNRILYLDEEIDVSDLNIKPEEIQYTVNGNNWTGETAARYIVRQNPLYSTIATTGFPEFTRKDNGCVATVKYTYHAAWTQELVEKVIAGYDEAMALIQPGDSDFAKILKLHDWIVKNVSYGMSTTLYDFAAGALANRKAVCAGYAQCYQFLLNQVGIENIYIAAQTKSEPHAWNLVKYEGHWFHVDCTWDRGLSVNPNVHHTYFMLNDAEFNADGAHTEDWKDQGYPTNNLCSIENKFYEGNTDIATDEQIAANPITIKHVADSTQAYQRNAQEHWRTCPAGVEVGREKHTGNPCTACGYLATTYAVTVSGSGNGTASATPDTAVAGEEVALTATPETGYHFKEWKVVSGNVTIADNKFTMPAEAVEVQAIFEKDAPATYAVKVIPSENGAVTATPDTAAAGEEVALTATPEAGYHFKEWKVLSGNVTIADNKFTMPAEAVEVQAVFEENAPETYTVAVTSDGNGAASATPDAAEAGEEITLTATPEAGYHFKEWKVVSGNVTITDNKFTMPAEAVEVQAIFEENAPETYTVAVTSDGNGAVSATPDTAVAGAEITLTATPEAGYHFKEWKVVSGNVTITDNKFTMPAEAVEVQAVFEKNYTVVYDWGADAPADQQLPLDSGDYLTEAEAKENGNTSFAKEMKVTGVKDGKQGTWTFSGWDSGTRNADTNVITFAGSWTFTADVVPDVVPETGTLTFETNGGSAIDSVTADKGSTVDLNQYVPTRSGYTFNGWYAEAELNHKVTAVLLDGDRTLYAGWTKDGVGEDNGSDKPADNQKPTTSDSGNSNSSAKPAADTKTSAETNQPRTGDNTHLTIYLVAATLGLAVILIEAVFIWKRKQNKEDANR